MRVSSLCCVALGLLVSVNSFASELYKGKILEHKEWSTGKVKVMFNDSHAPNTFLDINHQLPHAKLSDDGYYVKMETSAINSAGTVGLPILTQGNLMLLVENTGDGTKFFAYTLTVCLGTSEHESLCSNYFDAVQLDPEGYIFTTIAPAQQYAYGQAGTYKDQVSVNLITDTQNVTSSSTGVIEIADGKGK